MNRIKMIMAAFAIVFTIGAVNAGAAGATITGTITVPSIPPCDFTASTTGGPPPATVTVVNGSFAGYGSLQPCDPSEVSLSGFTSSFSGFYSATLSAFAVDADIDLPIFGPNSCLFPFSSGMTLTGPALNGPYGGSAISAGSNCMISTSLALTDVNFS